MIIKRVEWNFFSARARTPFYTRWHLNSFLSIFFYTAKVPYTLINMQRAALSSTGPGRHVDRKKPDERPLLRRRAPLSHYCHAPARISVPRGPQNGVEDSEQPGWQNGAAPKEYPYKICFALAWLTEKEEEEQ